MITREQAQLLANELNDSGGFTYDYNRGRLEPKPDSDLYAVGILPKYSIVNDSAVNDDSFWKKVKESVDSMILKHSKLTDSKAYRIGGWLHMGKLYIDTVVLINDKNTAIDKAKKENQISIFNLYNQKETNTGGTGTGNQ